MNELAWGVLIAGLSIALALAVGLHKLAEAITDTTPQWEPVPEEAEEESRERVPGAIAIGYAYDVARKRMGYAINGICPEGKDCPPTVDSVLCKLVFDLTGDSRFDPEKCGTGGGC